MLNETISPDALRARHNLRPVTEAEEGFGVERLPNGVYGFAYAPAQPVAPLFRKRTLRAYEMQKRADGSVHLIEFVTVDAAAKLENAEQATPVALFADARGDATVLVGIDTSRIVRHREHSQREGKGLQLDVAP